ncbi:MAG: universal stress protein [Nitrosopumilus sp.]|nr:universal stress protein [Nitrosopumilus sp.]MDH3737532.1 universal stress protein [Nitrosopumilus sp.]MDH3822989.1 universal stress protein [Nitrosopumilus sp.]MDH3834493.1 universal stress protein [Nitrosopumilus sp.]
MLKKILVPFDGSKYSEKAFDKALEIAEKFESELIIMTVIQSELPDSVGMSLQRLEEIQNEQEDKANAMLKKLETRTKAKNVSFSIKIIHNPSSSDAIVTFADKNNLDLIVMGSHGRTGLRKIVLGSVANGVLGRANCPVLITKGTDDTT